MALIRCCTFMFFIAFTTTAHADWTLDGEQSVLSYGSIKNNAIGEANSFSKLNGTITDKGKITLHINLASVETWVDTRNSRMKEFLFQVGAHPLATLIGDVDPANFKNLNVGQSLVVETVFSLDLHGIKKDIEAELLVIRLAKDKVLVLPNEMIFIEAGDFGLLAGLKKLQQLAKLSSITTAVPVNFHLIYRKN